MVARSRIDLRGRWASQPDQAKSDETRQGSITQGRGGRDPAPRHSRNQSRGAQRSADKTCKWRERDIMGDVYNLCEGINEGMWVITQCPVDGIHKLW